MEIIFEAIVVVIFSIALWKINKWVSLFLLISLFSMFYPVYGKRSFLAFHAILYGLLFYYFLIVCFPVNRINVLLNCLCLICIVHACFQIVQLLNIHFIVKPLGETFHSYPGLMANKNEISALIAICFPAFLRKRWLYLIPIPSFSLIASASFGGPMALLLGLFIAVSLQFPRSWLLVILLLLAVLYLGFVDTPDMAGRITIWKDGFSNALRHPLLGVGIGHWKLIFKSANTAHNEYLQCFFEMGFLPLIFISGYFLRTLKHFRIHVLSITGIVIAAINSMYNFTFHIAPTAMVSLLWMAIFEMELRYGWRKQRST